MHNDRYLKNSVSKSIVHVIKHANFQIYRDTLTEFFRKSDNLRQIYKQTSSTFYTSNDVSLKRSEKKKLLGRHKQDISLKIC